MGSSPGGAISINTQWCGNPCTEGDLLYSVNASGTTRVHGNSPPQGCRDTTPRWKSSVTHASSFDCESFQCTSPMVLPPGGLGCYCAANVGDTSYYNCNDPGGAGVCPSNAQTTHRADLAVSLRNAWACSDSDKTNLHVIELLGDITFIKAGSNVESALHLSPGSRVHLRKYAAIGQAGPVTIRRASEIGSSVAFRLVSLDSAELTLEDISLEGGLFSMGSGGGIDAFQSTLALSRSQIIGNTALKGGGISLRSSADGVAHRCNLLLSNSSITGNSATDAGGGIWISHKERVSITVTGVSSLHSNTPVQSCASGSAWNGQVQDSATLSCSDCPKGKWSKRDVTEGICVDCPSK